MLSSVPHPYMLDWSAQTHTYSNQISSLQKGEKFFSLLLFRTLHEHHMQLTQRIKYVTFFIIAHTLCVNSFWINGRELETTKHPQKKVDEQKCCFPSTKSRELFTLKQSTTHRVNIAKDIYHKQIMMYQGNIETDIFILNHLKQYHFCHGKNENIQTSRIWNILQHIVGN